MQRILRINKGKLFCSHDWQEIKTIPRFKERNKEWAYFKCSKCPAEKWHEMITVWELGNSIL